jgi:hypothetical protein
MSKPENPVLLILTAFVGIVLLSCAHEGRVAVHGTARDEIRWGGGTSPDDFAREISRLEAIADSDKGALAKAKAHLDLSLLHSHHRNPAPDCLQALRHLEQYVALDPDGGKSDAVQNRLLILRELDKARKSSDALKQENLKLKETIEKLNQLDMQIEEKRKDVK